MNLIPRNFLFDDDLEDFFVTKPSKRGEMKCDIYEKDNKYYIELDAPGFDKNSAVGILEEFKKKHPDTNVTATFFVNGGIFNQSFLPRKSVISPTISAVKRKPMI